MIILDRDGLLLPSDRRSRFLNRLRRAAHLLRRVSFKHRTTTLPLVTRLLPLCRSKPIRVAFSGAAHAGVLVLAAARCF